MAWWKHIKKSTPEQEAEFKEMLHEEKVSWKDRMAMVLAAYLTILLPCAVILVVVGLLILLIFGGL